MEPSPPTNADKQRRIRRASQNLACLEWMAPNFRKLHPVGAQLPQECVSLMSPSFLSDQFDTMYNVPGYRKWFLQQDLLPAYEFHRRFLQHLQERENGRRWILKAPTHMFGLPALLAIYPDALFLQTHRAPLEAITSVSSLITILRRVFSDAADPVEIGTEAISLLVHDAHKIHWRTRSPRAGTHFRSLLRRAPTRSYRRRPSHIQTFRLGAVASSGKPDARGPGKTTA